ncbi:MAG: serine hydrolase domain-containing protein, partial [Planctomycetota bacterium]
MHRKILPLVLGFLGLAAHAAPPVAFEDPGRRAKLAAAYPEVDRVMRDFVARENVPGAAWGIVVDGELAHVGTVGLRDVEAAQPVQGDSVFRIASMTKSFTAMAVLKLRDQGKLSLDDPVERYVPELRGLRPLSSDAPRITLRHLLTMSAGFPEDNPWGDQQLGITEQ